MNEIVLKEEQQKLDSVIAYVNKEKDRLKGVEAEQKKEAEKLKLAAGGSFTMDSFVAEKIHHISRKLLDNINKSLSTPYFTRVDFTGNNNNEMQLYIGKWGVTDTRTQTPVIIDWRSPIANLYYTHQVGEASYTTPEGEVQGEITLKRLFDIKDAEIKSIIEADIISEGDYLNDVLSDHADSRLKDIVTTIQSEQNAVLRCNHKIPLIVQGVAGAGKTTIALHRIMWMLYTFQDTMEPANIMVIAPSPLFLDYISAVLPEMGVEDVIQETFYGLALRLCGTKLFKPDDSYILLKLLDNNAPDEEKEYYRSYAQFKGSLVFKEILLKYISSLSYFILPQESISFEGREILSEDKIKSIYNKELAPFNMTDRKKELKKSLKNIINSFIISEKTSLEMKAKKRANLIRELYKNDTAKRQSLMQELYAKRDGKLEDLAKFSATVVEEYIKKISILPLLESYKHFLKYFSLPDEFSDYAEQWTAAQRITLANIENKKIETSDIPPLLIIQNALFGYKERLNIHHTVLDEAQDFSPFMFDTLKSFTRNNSFTIVGDLAQGIYAYQGVQDWLKMKDNVFGESSQYYELVTSYRNTVEIMELAESCAMRHSHNRTPATPVLRHGSLPKLIKAKNISEQIAEEIKNNINLGMKTIAVIDKMPDECKKLYTELKKFVPEITYLDDKNTVYQGGIMVMPAYLCKGLEFDCVIIANCERDNFKDDFLHSRLLYVCLTRPIHKLSIYYSNTHSELINRQLCENIEV